MSDTNVIPCKGKCNTMIFWDITQNKYLEVGTQKQHFCPNYKKSNTLSTTSTNTYKKPFVPYKQKEPVECSVINVKSKKEYERISDMIRDSQGKIHGVQSHVIGDEVYQVIYVVFFEVPIGKRELIK